MNALQRLSSVSRSNWKCLITIGTRE